MTTFELPDEFPGNPVPYLGLSKEAFDKLNAIPCPQMMPPCPLCGGRMLIMFMNELRKPAELWWHCNKCSPPDSGLNHRYQLNG